MAKKVSAHEPGVVRAMFIHKLHGVPADGLHVEINAGETVQDATLRALNELPTGVSYKSLPDRVEYIR